MNLSDLTRVVNRGGRVLHRSGLPLVKLDERTLLAEACRRTRLDDYGDAAFREPLRRLLASIDRDAELSLIGRIAARQDMLRLLSNRLQMQRDRRLHPEIAAAPIRRPVFVTGLPRTGTTALHGLLAAPPGHRAPLHWEMMFPSPASEALPHGRDPRIEWTARQLRWFHRLNPEFKRIHEVGAEMAEECLIITSHSFESFQFETMYRVTAYQEWLEARDLRTSYAAHRAFLQHLQWRDGTPRWFLKAPAHLYGIEAIFAVYPDAKVIFTHRDPLEVVPSMASLHVALRSTFSDDVDPAEVGQELSARWARGLARALAARDAGIAPADRFIDVRYTALLRDPIGVVRDIYARIDEPFTRAVETVLRRHLAQNPKDKHGAHRYSLGQFGLDPLTERERYRFYTERFLRPALQLEAGADA